MQNKKKKGKREKKRKKRGKNAHPKKQKLESSHFAEKFEQKRQLGLEFVSQASLGCSRSLCGFYGQ
jgi:hypothetical protein